MIGIMEAVLSDRYGPPAVSSSDALGKELRWNAGDELLECVLFKLQSWSEQQKKTFGSLEALYGDARGGFLLGSSLKLSSVRGPAIFGLYEIDDLQCQPEVGRAAKIDPQICYFMDAANVWFYGLKKGELFVFDSEACELDSLGPLQTALWNVLTEYEDA